jgi:hypothetical protein
MAPESLRSRLAGAFTFAALLLIAATPAHALRILDYNILNYPGTTGPARNAYFRTIIQPIHPDLVVTEETLSQAGVSLFLSDVLNTLEPGQWAAMPFVDGNDTDGALFYKPSKFSPPTQLSFYPNSANLLRLIHEYIVHPLGYTSQASEIRIYSCHLKASTGFESQRLAEATGWRDSMNANPPGTHALAMGDFNFYNGNEPGFLKFLESQVDNDGRLYDPLNLQGLAWQNNAAIAVNHTQSPCLSGGAACASGASTGGLDDRFDLILASYSWNDGRGYELVPGSYVSVGNDGLHLNLNITDPPTIPEGAAYAQALQLASDHLPVRIDIQVPAISSVASSLDLGRVISGGAGSLSVSNVALAPADGLTYTLTAPAGFSAPAGTLELAAGNATSHSIGTTPGSFGPRGGNLTLASDDLDNPNRTVALTANVLDHAHASLDSTVEQTSGSVDFGNIPAGAFTRATVAVHNYGYSSLQAKLHLSPITITGGDGHFSIVGNPSTLDVEDVGVRFEIAFDPNGATPDSQYTATFTVESNDEPLPGGQPAATLTVALAAQVYTGPLAAPIGPELPVRTQLYTPFPNPLSFASRVQFDLSKRTDLKLDVLDLAGRRVATLADRSFEPGRYALRWSGQDETGAQVPAGIYFVRMSGERLVAQTARLAVIR